MLRIGKRENRENNELLAGDKEISVFGPIEIEIQTLVAKMYHLRKPECGRQVGLRGVWREPSKSRFSLSQWVGTFRESALPSPKRISRAGTFGIVTGLIMMVFGAIEFILVRGLMLLLVPVLFGLGFILLKSGIDTITGRPFRPSYRRGLYIRPSGRGSDYLDREAEMEEKKEQDLESGVND